MVSAMRAVMTVSSACGRKTLRAGEIAVVGNEDDGVEATVEEEEGEGGQHAHQPKVALRDGEHIAKEVGGGGRS